MLRLGQDFPDFACDTSTGHIDSIKKWMGGSWSILFSHPKDFTPVCTTELGAAASLSEEFKKRGVKMIAISCDSVEDHKNWGKDIVAYAKSACGPSSCGDEVPFPIIDDSSRQIIEKLGMHDPQELDGQGTPLSARAVFVVGPNGKLRASILYPASTGRNFHEILRLVDSLQLTEGKRVATPEGWTPGAKVMVHPGVKLEEQDQLFPSGVEQPHALPSGKHYLRYTMPPQ